MAYFSNRDINRLALHSGIGALGWALSGAFSAVFLIRVGLTPAQIFLTFAVTLALRFVMRPLVLYAAPLIGLRRVIILGGLLGALSCPALALVMGSGLGLRSMSSSPPSARCFIAPRTMFSLRR